MREYLRLEPRGLDECGPLTPFLGVLLPELGAPADGCDPPTLQAALRAALCTIAGRRPTLLLLDDLHWADQSTLETISFFASALESDPCLAIGTYRSDEIPRGHALRRLRRDLRRAGRLRELTLEPLDQANTAALAAQIFGQPPDAELAGLLFARTQGMPFYVEEVANALLAAGRIRRAGRRARLTDAGEFPVPESVRDAVGMRTAGMSPPGRAALEVAAVAGMSVELDLLVVLTSEGAVEEALGYGVLIDGEQGRAVFRHSLIREAVYADVPWTRRRKLHGLLAEQLELRNASVLTTAEQWLSAREFERACRALAAVAAQFAGVHAYGDALGAGRRALDAWPDGADEEARLALVAEVGRFAQLAGELPEAAAAWRELADRRKARNEVGAVAEAERQLATVYELQGALELGLAARRASADAFSRARRPGDAAGELLAAAAQLDSAGSVAAALQLADRALADAREAGRRDLEARALGIQGTARAKLGEIDAGVEAARAALDLALAEDLTAAAAEAYQRLANTLEQAGDYGAAWDAYQAGFEFCEARDQKASAHVCLVCLAAILLFTGEWDRALRLDRDLLAAPDSPLGTRMGAKQHMGLIGAARGDVRRARPLLLESGAYASRFERQRMEVWDAMGHGWLDELEDADDAALDRCRFILARWGESQSVHYPVPALRWATTFCAEGRARLRRRGVAPCGTDGESRGASGTRARPR